MAHQVFKTAASSLFSYGTQKIVIIRNLKVAIIYRTVYFAILAYIVVYAIWYKRGYQEFDNVHGAVTTKVKGIIFSNASGDDTFGRRTWDVADYVIPPKENNAFFVMTNVIVTAKQNQTTCAENSMVPGADCTHDESICQKHKGQILRNGNGPLTGECIDSTNPAFEGNKSCEIIGWCPLEIDQTPHAPVLASSDNFTVFIKNNIEFPHFDVARRNLPEHENDTYLQSCTYNSRDPRDKFCPIFNLKTIVEGAGVSYENISVEGGVIQIIIDWTCDLDHSEDDCIPEYSFRRLDKGDFSLSRGFNFRYADKFIEGNTLYRTLYKAYGIRFMITLQGRAGKFSIVPLVLNFGSGLGLLAIATTLCDLLVTQILHKKQYYRKMKYLDVDEVEADEADFHVVPKNLAGRYVTDDNAYGV